MRSAPEQSQELSSLRGAGRLPKRPSIDGDKRVRCQNDAAGMSRADVFGLAGGQPLHGRLGGFPCLHGFIDAGWNHVEIAEQAGQKLATAWGRGGQDWRLQCWHGSFR